MKRISLIASFACLLMLAFVCSGSNSFAAESTPSVDTFEKATITTSTPATASVDAILNKRTVCVEGPLLSQADLDVYNGSFDHAVRIPEAPSFATDHVPRL